MYKAPPTSLNYTPVHYKIRFYKVLKGKASVTVFFYLLAC